MEQLQAFVDQIVALSWVRCAIQEGVKFLNKETGLIETNEMVVFQHMEHQTGAFDLPQADVSPASMERTLYETIGRFYVNNNQADVRQMIEAADFRAIVQQKIKVLREKNSQLLRGSQLDDLERTTHEKAL